MPSGTSVTFGRAGRVECLFCQILEGTVPGSLAYRDSRCAVIADLFPANEGHMLIVPTIHVARFPDLPSEVAGHLLAVGRDVAGALRSSSVRSDGFTIALSDGEVAGQEIFHTHLHVIPRFEDDGYPRAFFPRDPEPREREALDRMVEELRARLGA